MSHLEDTEVNRLLEGAAKLTAKVLNCWLVTLSGAGGANARPMGRVLPDPSLNDWKILFLTDGRSRKAAEIRGASGVELIFQNDPDEAFAALAGLANLIDDPSEVGKLWKANYDAYFPTAETGPTRRSSKSLSTGWSFGSAASRRSRWGCSRP